MARKQKPSSRAGGRKSSGRERASRSRSARSAAGRSAGASRSRRDGRVTDVISFLKRQHDQTRKLFQALAVAEGDARREAFARLADLLAVHAKLEEQMIYPEMARAGGLEEFVHDSLEEHLVVKRILADLLEKNLDEEEAALFPKARRALGRERGQGLLPEMQQQFEQLMQHEPRSRVPNETDSAPTLPTLQ